MSKPAKNCLARTSPDWFSFIINNNNGLTQSAIFWNPHDQQFHALEKNSRIFFYNSKKKEFIGVGTFSGVSSIKDVQTAWNNYGTRIGQSNLHSFIDLLTRESNTLKNIGYDYQICCIEVEDIKRLKKSVPYNYTGQQMFKKLDDEEILLQLEQSI